MLANSTHNNMLLISPTTNNQWPQPQNHIDEKPNTLVMEKSQPHQQHQQQPPPPPPHQQVLKCPRCDSSNTKFCYYNNYSLSQPRHFCKACKRYWTRGGTLRNVPVGGGCRKNKRVKRAPSSAVAAAGPGIEGGCSNNNLNPNPNSSSQNPQIEISISSPHHQISPFFFGSEMNNLNPFHGRFNSGYDLNGLGLGFSSTTSGSSMLSNYSIFGSSLQQLHQNQNQSKLMSMKDAVHQNYHGSGGALTAFEELQLSGNNNNNSESAGICTSTTVKGSVKVELQQDHHQQNRFDWNNINNNNQIEQIGYSSLDPTLYWNPNTSNSTSVGSLWHDNPNSNIGSSLTSLI